MDLVDKSLLSELMRNGRIAFSELATRLNIPVEEVGSRIQRLVYERVILKFTVVPSPALFGAKEAIIFFRSREDIALGLINSLGVHPTVESLSIGSNNEGFALIHFRTISELYSVVRYFQKVGKFEDIKAYQIQPLSKQKDTKLDIFSLQDIDWLMLIYLREEGRLSLSDLSIRTNIAIETIMERLQFLRENHMIEETIQLNPIKTTKENWTIFLLKLTLFTDPFHKELTRELKSIPGFWESWRVEEKPILLLKFLFSSYTEVEKIQSWLTEISPGLISIEKILGGVTYYFSDFRDEALDERRSAEWFQPERWVKD
ncbi:MAG: AsnC family transcriptional regulator [Candidatus Hodarchaeota archaeon]